MAETFLYVIFPYIALVVAIGGGLYRYFSDRYSYSSLSSQLLEHRSLFWGTIPWHYGIVPILLAHLAAAVFPDWMGILHRGPGRLAFVGVTGIVLGLFALSGIIILTIRRITSSRARAVTSPMDWLLIALLLLQTVLGVYISFAWRWGSLWYLHTATPWLYSLAVFAPDASAVVHLPLAVKIHLVNAFVLILLFPFTRLAHIFSFPIRYLLRPWQIVVWNRWPRSGGQSE